MSIGSAEKDPQAQKDYQVSWADWLADGEEISSFEVTVPTGLTQPQAATNTTSVVTFWLAGGTAGVNYTVWVKAATNAGRVDRQSVLIKVVEE